MEARTRILDLLNEWEEAQAAGRELSLRALCRDCPELLPAVESALHLLHGFDNLVPRMALAGSAGMPPTHPRFTFTRFLAAGGMGAVWAAYDTQMRRPVAIKILVGGFLLDDLRRRIEDEAALAGSLGGPGIVPVYDVGQLDDGRPFLVMKLIQGKTLTELLKERPSPLHDQPRWIAIFEEICRIVGHAHQSRILHRDLKPSNVMVNETGTVHVLDWGIAKVLSTDRDSVEPPSVPAPSQAPASHPPRQAATTSGDATTPTAQDGTQLGQAKGTTAYMAPEQARGEPRRISTRTDVFGLGGILAAILTNHPTYEAENHEQLLALARAADQSQLIERLDACGADRELIALARWCLQPEPEDRPRNANQVAEVVRNHRLLVGLRASLPPAGPLLRLVQRRPYGATVLFALLPHALGSLIVIVYSLLWAAHSWPESLPVLVPVILVYSASALVLTGLLALLLTRPWLTVLRHIQQRRPVPTERIHAARRQALGLQFWAYGLSALGWLPGGLLVPALLGAYLGPVDGAVLVYFVVSFVVLGGIALTYSSLVSDFLILRVSYPWLWHLPLNLVEEVRAELHPDPPRYRLLPLLATQIPLAAVLVLLLAATFGVAQALSGSALLLFQGLAVLLLVLGMIGSVLAGYLADRLRRLVAGFYTALGLPTEPLGAGSRGCPRSGSRSPV